MWLWAGVLAALLVVGAEASAADLEVHEVARGSSWVSPYWGYNTPKIVFDGTAYYTAGLWGPVETAEGTVYKYVGGAWRVGARLPGIYQPATLLLDGAGRLLVFYTRKASPLRVLRSQAPGDIDRFDELPEPPGMVSAYYIGVAIRGDTVYLAYIIDQTPPLEAPPYTMFLTTLNLTTLTWSPAVVMQQGQTETKPKTAWTYPILVPRENGLHVVATNSPDGGEGNTYNQVWYLFYPDGAAEPAVRELVASGPIGCFCYALDMTVDPGGAVHVLHMFNVRAYGEPLPEGSPPAGTYHVRRDAQTGAWHSRMLAPVCIAGFYQDAKTLSAVTQENGGMIRWEWDAPAEIWNRAETLCAADRAPGPPSFMDVLSASSGSDLRAGLAIVTDSILPQQDAPGARVVWSLLPTKSPAQKPPG